MRRIVLGTVVALSVASVAGAHTRVQEVTQTALNYGATAPAAEQVFDPAPFAFPVFPSPQGDAAGWAMSDPMTALLLHGFGTVSYGFALPVSVSDVAQGLSQDPSEEINTAEVTPVPLPGSLSLVLSVLSVYALARILAFLLAFRSEQRSQFLEHQSRAERLQGHFRV